MPLAWLFPHMTSPNSDLLVATRLAMDQKCQALTWVDWHAHLLPRQHLQKRLSEPFGVFVSDHPGQPLQIGPAHLGDLGQH